MIDGNPNDFLDTMLWGDQIVFKFNDIDYCYMGKKNSDNLYDMEIVEYNKENPVTLWSFSGQHSDDGLQNFLHSTIFDNKTFSEVEHEITWVKE